MAKILITGGTGMIGSALIPKLLDKGHEIRILSRSKQKMDNVLVFTWDVDKGEIEAGALDNVDHIIHLAGYSVSSGRWTKKRKQLIQDSRIKAIDLLRNRLGIQRIKSFISSSGVSIYGTVTSDHIFHEEDALKTAKNDFLARVSIQWENAAHLCKSVADRVVIMRTPVVLGDEGALPRLTKPIKMGFGSALGSGKQWVPWVHIEDIANAYVFAVENENIKGPFNITADEHVTNKELTQKAASVLNKKLWLPKVPSFLLKLLFGSMANIILKGSRVDNSKLKQTGFEFKFPKIHEALKDLLSTY